MDEPKKGEKLSKVWTHTISVVGLLAAVVSIISFFGFHPGATPGTPTPPRTPAKGNSPEQHLAANADSSPNKPPIDAGKAPRAKGIGTLHLDGGFTTGQPMLSTAPIAQANGVSAPLTLKDSRSARIETVDGAMVPLAVDGNHLVFIWRKGTRFIHGLRLTAAVPHVNLSAPGISAVEVPTDADGKLNQTLIWPADRMFASVEFAGPVQIDGHTLDGGVTVGDLDTQELGITLPTKFSLDLPKPGEILAAIKGEFTYPSGSGATRYVVVQAVPGPNEKPISWAAELKRSDPTELRTTQGGVLDKGLYAIKILVSKTSLTDSK